MTDANLQSLISERRRQWAELPPAQRMHRIQTALIGVVDLARWRRQQARRRTAQRLAQQPAMPREYARL